MAWYEKQAWLTLLPMVIAYSIYFPLVAMHQYPMMQQLWLFGGITGTQALIVIIVMTFAAIRNRDEASARKDERDRAIARRGATLGYYTLMPGIIIVGMIMPFHDPATHIMNTALFALVLAESVRLYVIIRSYRSGWHG